MAIPKFKDHGLTGTSEYTTWVEINRRCFSKKCKQYVRYGGRGITVCSKWRNSFTAFLDDVGYKPGKEYSLDRIDNSGNYEPGNCRWATMKTQSNNRSNNHRLTYKGKTQTIQQWCDEIKMADTTFHNRLRRGWDIGKILETPVMTQFGKG